MADFRIYILPELIPHLAIELGNSDIEDSAQNKKGTVDKDEADFRGTI
jgi:hypothetical protein